MEGERRPRGVRGALVWRLLGPRNLAGWTPGSEFTAGKALRQRAGLTLGDAECLRFRSPQSAIFRGCRNISLGGNLSSRVWPPSFHHRVMPLEAPSSHPGTIRSMRGAHCLWTPLYFSGTRSCPLLCCACFCLPPPA